MNNKPPNQFRPLADLLAAFDFGRKSESESESESESALGSFKVEESIEVEECDDVEQAIVAFETSLAKAQHVDHASTLFAAFVNSPLPLNFTTDYAVSLLVHPQVPSELLFRLAAHLICAAEEHEKREATTAAARPS